MTRHNGKNLEFVCLPRLVLIDHRLARPNGATVSELAAKCNCCEKTVRRDLEILRRLYGSRLQVAVEDFNRKRYKVAPSYQVFAAWVADEVKALNEPRKPREDT